MNHAQLVLVGIPGSGKSTIGALLAASLGVPLIETDQFTEHLLGQTATETFADPTGESRWRAAEVQAVIEALNQPGVIAVGSGAVTSEAVRVALRGRAVCWLRTTVVTATRRLGMTRLGIEVLTAIRIKLDAQLAERAGWYAEVATTVIDTDRSNASAIAEELLGTEEDR